MCFAGAATAYSVGFTEVRWEQWGELALGGFSGLGAAALFLMTFIGNIWVCYTCYVIFKCLYMLLITIAMQECYMMKGVVLPHNSDLILLQAEQEKEHLTKHNMRLRYQIAADLSMERYALVFGANNFGALALQTIITSVVVDSGGLGLGIIPQVSRLKISLVFFRCSRSAYVLPLLLSTQIVCFFFLFVFLQFTVYASYFSVIAVVFTLRGLFTIWRAQRSSKDSTPPVKNEPPDEYIF